MIKGIYKATQGMAYEALRIDILALHPENARRAREKVLQRLIRYGKISSQEFREAFSEPIPTKRHPMPFKAPHPLAQFGGQKSCHPERGQASAR